MNKPVASKPMPFVEPHEQDIERAKLGDQNAMYRLYSSYSKAMLNSAHRILNNRQDAEDVLQDSFVKIFSQLHQFSYQSSFGSWIKRIVINASIDQLNRKRNDLSLYEDHEVADEEHNVIHIDQENGRQAQLDLMYKALLELPDGYRTVLSLYMLEGYDHEEISTILNIGVSTSISQLSRAKKKLRAIIQKIQEP